MSDYPGEGMQASLSSWPGLPARSWTPDPRSGGGTALMPGYLASWPRVTVVDWGLPLVSRNVMVSWSPARLVDTERCTQRGGRPGVVAMQSVLAGGVRGGASADDRPGGVDKGAAGVAFLDGRVGLQHAVQGLTRPGPAVAGLDGAVLRVDDALGGGREAAPALGVADRENRVAELDLAGVADADRLQAGGALQAQQGDVVARVVAHQVGLVRLAGGHQGHRDAGGLVDHVVVREHEAVA